MVALWSVSLALSAVRRSAWSGMCLVLHRGSDLLLLLCTKSPSPALAPPQKQDSSLGVAAQWERHVAGVETLLFLSGQKQSDPAEEFTQQWKSLMSENNTKSRRVGWRLCRSPWDWVLALGHDGDGQHQKHGRVWRGEAGSGVQGYFQLWWIFTEGPGRTLGSSRSGDLEK